MSATYQNVIRKLNTKTSINIYGIEFNIKWIEFLH